jgi:hypothetical protein
MYTLIVKRGDLGRYDMLYKAFGERMPVIWERRHRERRKRGDVAATEERRDGDRRGPPTPSWIALGFVVVDRN